MTQRRHQWQGKRLAEDSRRHVDTYARSSCLVRTKLGCGKVTAADGTALAQLECGRAERHASVATGASYASNVSANVPFLLDEYESMFVNLYECVSSLLHAN